MIDYEKLSFWIGCQLDDLNECYDQNPSDKLYGAIKAYTAINAQLNLAWCIQESQEAEESVYQPPFEGSAEPLSSCCSVHAGTTDECQHEEEEIFAGQSGTTEPLQSYKIAPDPIVFWQSTSNKCQHEPEMDIGKDGRPRFEKSKNPMCKHCGEMYPISNAAKVVHDLYQQLTDVDLPRTRSVSYDTCNVESKDSECQHESDGETYHQGMPNGGIPTSSWVKHNRLYKCIKCWEFYR